MGREEEEGRGVREKSVSPWVQQNKSSPPKQNVNECVSERLTPSHHDIPSPLLLQPRQPVITLSVIQVQIKVEAAADFRSLEHL